MRYALFKYVLVIWICGSLALVAQEKKEEKKPETPGHAYKVDVVLSESEGGKTVNTRTYTMLINDQDTGRIRQGDRIPVITAKEGSGPNQIQYQYLDVGLNLDCRLSQKNDGLYLSTVLDMSSLAPEQSATGSPIVRQQRYQTGSFVQPGKRTVIANVDQLDSKRKLQIEALLTQVQ